MSSERRYFTRDNRPDVPVCKSCHDVLYPDAPKVSSGAGWLCQACAYAEALGILRLGTWKRPLDESGPEA